MSEKTEKTTQDKFEDAAFSNNLGSISFLDGPVDDEKDITLSDIGEVNAALKSDDLTAKIKLKDKTIIIAFRYPSPNELALIEGSFLSARVLENLPQLNEDSGDFDLLEDEDISRDLVNNLYKKMCKVVSLCARLPFSEESVAQWDSDWVDAIYNRLMRNSRGGAGKQTSADTFHKVGDEKQ